MQHPEQDGNLVALDDGSTMTSELLAEHLPTSKFVKAFNNTFYGYLRPHGTAARTPGRRPLPVEGTTPTPRRSWRT